MTFGLVAVGAVYAAVALSNVWLYRKLRRLSPELRCPKCRTSDWSVDLLKSSLVCVHCGNAGRIKFG